MKAINASINLVSIFDALSEPHRLSIFCELLGKGPVCVGNLAASIALSDALTSQHLKVLHHAGLVARNKHGRFVYYQVDENLKYIENLVYLLKT